MVHLRVGSVDRVLSAGAIEEDDDKLGQAVTNMPLTSLKRLVGRQAVTRTGHKPECPSGRSIKIALCIEASAIDWRFESWQERTVAPSPCLAEPAFSGAASLGICAIANLPSGSRQGIRIGDTNSLVLMIRNFNS